LDDGRSGLLDCPHCGKEWRVIDEENEGGWFLPWICLVALFGIIIVDSLMSPDTFTKDQSFWDSLFRGGGFGFWNFIVSVIIFILLLLFGALALLLSFLPDAEPDDGMQFEIDNEFDEQIENAIIQGEQIKRSLGRYAIIDVDGFFNLNRTLLVSSFFIIVVAMLGGGGTHLSTLELVSFWVISLSVFLVTTFIEIRNLFASLGPWEWLSPGQDIHDPVMKVGVSIAAIIAFIAIISFGWPALLVVGIVLIIYAATRWANE